MIKDPLSKGLDPYEVFEIKPAATREQVNAAWAQFMRSGMKRLKITLSEGQLIFKKLLNPLERFGIDIFYYQTMEINTGAISAAELKELSIHDFWQVKPLDESLFLDAYLADISKDVQDYKFAVPKLKELDSEWRAAAQHPDLVIEL